MKYSYLPVLIFFLTLFGSCNRATDSNERSATEAISGVPIAKTDSHDSVNYLDWEGVYKGTLPCPNCEGIETTLTLNEDLTYHLKTNYLGRNDALEEEKSGVFSWNEDGSVITLEDVDAERNKFQVGENLMWQLDLNGNMIRGDSADHYILTKIN